MSITKVLLKCFCLPQWCCTQTVVLDYIQSEIQLKSSRDKSQLELACKPLLLSAHLWLCHITILLVHSTALISDECVSGSYASQQTC